MKAYVVLDSAFLIATIDGNDHFHEAAVFLFEEFKMRSDALLLIVPPLVLYEVIVTLGRKGIGADNVQEILLRFVNLQYVSVLALSEVSAFKHARHALNANNKDKSLRTHDFMIFCVGAEFEAVIITFDYKMLAKCRSVYSAVYYPSDIGDKVDDTAAVLAEIDTRLGEDVNEPSYKALKTLPF